MWQETLCLSCQVLVLVIVHVGCDSGFHPTFLPSLRDYATNEIINNSDVRTLQNPKLYAEVNNVSGAAAVTAKHITGAVDSLISESSHSRGLHPYEHPGHPGFDAHEIEEAPHYGYSFGPQPHFESHIYEPHGYHHNYNLGHYHHKHYNPALTAKAILLPVAGLALLGAAAALVHNPILLQLGVVSGRRRRDTEATRASHPINKYGFLYPLFDRSEENQQQHSQTDTGSTKMFGRAKRNSIQRESHKLLSIERVSTVSAHRRQKHKLTDDDERTYVPIPLQFIDNVARN